MNLGIIGYGNIGEILVKNIINSKSINFNKLYVSNRHVEKINHLKNISESICITDSNKLLAKNCDKIIISVETPDLTDVIKEIKPYLKENTHITHCSAGVNKEELKKIYSKPITNVIPTIASSYEGEHIKKGISLFLHDENVSSENRKYIENLFSKFSIVKKLSNENDLRVALIATSCMPAFISQITLQLSEKLSLKSEINEKEIKNMIYETLFSTSILLKEEIFDNDELIGKVATKGGITQKGVDFIDKNMNNIENQLINILL